MGENIDKKISFYQGANDLYKNENENEIIEKIKKKIASLSNVKNINFLLGSGTSAKSIPTMKKMQEDIQKSINKNKLCEEQKTLFNSINNDNLEKKLEILYAKKYYLEGIKKQTSNGENTSNELDVVENLIKCIEEKMFEKINVHFPTEETEKTEETEEVKKVKETLELYKIFYQKVTLRNKDLSRTNIFTTNADLFNEKALDAININFNTGFSSGLERIFNPARFHYTFSKKIDANLEKFEPLENMVYLYKLHGSINWIKKEGSSLFDIQEITVPSKKDTNHILIYPTPLKQYQSLSTPYSDLIREFQTKLNLPNSVLFIIGFSFSDDHINNIIYRSMASNSSISIVIFGEHSKCPLVSIKDNRICRIFGEEEKKEIHYFEYIVKNILPNLEENKEEIILKEFSNSLSNALENVKKNI